MKVPRFPRSPAWRAALGREIATERWRRPGAGELLLVFLALEVVASCMALLQGSATGLGRQLESLLITAFLIWRVSRGGRISRMLLILWTALSYAVLVLAVARYWNPAIVIFVLMAAAQIALLVSPPVFARTRRTQYPARIGWTQLVRRPPSWLLPWALFLGVLVTLACLGSIAPVPLPGCKPVPTGGCFSWTGGYPLRWLTGGQLVPAIGKYALLRDCAQWALACGSVLYLAWLWLTEPTGLRPAQFEQP
jgi:hypothetical protein